MDLTASAFNTIARKIFLYASERQEQVKKENTKFSHYTSAYAALQIIEKKNVWMRNAVLMNDFLEVEYGHERLVDAMREPDIGGRLCFLLNQIRPGLDDDILEAIDSRYQDRAAQTYMISISEHGDAEKEEDEFGRLSMWRAYGGHPNVAFVFNNYPFLNEASALNAFTSPVLYAGRDKFNREFTRMVDELERNIDIARVIGADDVHRLVFNAMHFAALSTKHPGFSEEREWRVIYSPTVWKSDKIESSVEVIGGVPQIVKKIPLRNYPQQGHINSELHELLIEIIIGPTENAAPIYQALVQKLEEAGVPDAAKKVRASDIPLRR